jgi:hypothetical protein
MEGCHVYIVTRNYRALRAPNFWGSGAFGHQVNFPDRQRRRRKSRKTVGFLRC